MQYQARLQLYGPDPLAFEDLCERLSSYPSAQTLSDYLLQADLPAADLEFAILALIHNGYRELASAILIQKADDVPEASKDTNRRDWAMICSHCGYLHLHQALEGDDPVSNRSFAADKFGQGSSIDAKSALANLGSAFMQLLEESPDSFTAALKSFRIVRNNLRATTTLIDINGLIAMGTGLAAFQLGLYDEALKDFRDVLRKYAPAIPLVRLAIGQTLMMQKKSDEATGAFKRSLDLSPENVVALTALATIEFNKRTEDSILRCVELIGRIDKVDANYPACQLLRSALYFSNPKRHKQVVRALTPLVDDASIVNRRVKAEAWYHLARVPHYKGNLDDAAELYGLALQCNPAHGRAAYGLALIAASRGQPREAVAHLKAAVTELHDFFEPYALLGLAHAEIYRTSGENMKEAIENLSAALAARNKAPNDGELVKIYLTLGWLRIKKLEFESAEESFLKALALQQSAEVTDDQVLMFLGICQFQLKRPEAALGTFKKCADQAPPLLRFNIARCKEELNDFAAARTIYIELHTACPKFADPLLRLAALALRDSRPGIPNVEAKRYLEEIIQDIDADHIQARLELAGVSARSKQYQEARLLMGEVEEKARRGDGSLYAVVSIGNYLLESAQRKVDPHERHKRIRDAQSHFFRALKANHGCVAAANGIAITWLLTDHIAEAKEQMNLVKDYRPDQSASWENLGLAYLREESYASAMTLFEEANKRFFDKTNEQMLMHCYSAAKGDRKYEICLSIAQQLCQIRPERQYHWYCLATAIVRVVPTQFRAAVEKGLRVPALQRWIKQMHRAVVLFTTYLETEEARSGRSQIEEKISAANHWLPKLQEALVKAREAEQKRQLEFQREAIEETVDLDPYADGLPRPQ
jgi:tetratricopeptide (TPR) repeat protein